MDHAIFANLPWSVYFQNHSQKGIYNEVQKTFLVLYHILAVERV